MTKNKPKIDKIDRKILNELDKDSRKTDSEISRQIKTSKQVVNYRVSRLLNEGIIKNFYSIIDVGKLGYDSYYLFFQLENITEDEQKKFLKKAVGKNYIGWVIEGIGKWELILLVFAKNIEIFKERLDEILFIYSGKVSEHKFCLLTKAEHRGYKQINEESKESVLQTVNSKVHSLKEVDKKIIREVSQDARASLIEISEKTKLPLHVVKYNLKNLIKSRIIEGFKPKLNLNKLDLEWYLILINFKEDSSREKRKKLLDFLKEQREVYYLTSTIGEYDLMIDLHISKISQLKSFISKIKQNFPELIKSYDLLNVFQEHKIEYFPEDVR